MLATFMTLSTVTKQKKNTALTIFCKIAFLGKKFRQKF